MKKAKNPKGDQGVKRLLTQDTRKNKRLDQFTRKQSRGR